MKKLREQETVLDKIKGFCHIHAAGVDIRPVPHEVADGLNHTPSTHSSGAAGLVSKLKLIKSKSDSIEYKDDPIDEFENKATYRNRPIVSATVYTSKFILDDRDQSCQYEEQ